MALYLYPPSEQRSQCHMQVTIKSIVKCVIESMSIFTLYLM